MADGCVCYQILWGSIEILLKTIFGLSKWIDRFIVILE